VNRVVSLSKLPPDYAKRCHAWLDALSPERRGQIEAWLTTNEPLPGVDLVTYTYFAAPGTIDPWVICRVAAKDATAEWHAENQPNVEEILPTGEVRVRYRESELIGAPC